MKLWLGNICSVLGVAGVVSLSAFADAPAGYYNSLEGKTGKALSAAVKDIVRKHTVISYGDDTWSAFRHTDVRVVNGKECWWDMYSTNNVAISSGHPGMNIEHSVANSWWGGTNNDAYKDINHLNPSDSDGNSRKSNYPLTELGTVKWYNGAVNVGTPKSGQGGGSSNGFEPVDEYKGDFARTYMYMFVTYDDINWGRTKGGQNVEWMFTASPFELKPWAKELLLRWSANDPVSQKERDRNDGVYSQQKNRNPFIDLPDLAEYIWGDKNGQPYHVDGAHVPDPVDPVDPDPTDPDPVNPDPVDPDPLPDDPDLIPGTFVLVASQSEIRAGESYLILGASSEVAMTLTQNKDQTYFEPTYAVSITDGVIKNAPSDAAVITLETLGDGYALKASDMKGNAHGYLFSSGQKKIDLTDYSTTEGVKAKLTYSAQGVAVVYGSSASTGSGALYYNSSAKRFTTYTSNGQERLNLFRLVKETSAVDEIDDDSFMVEVWGNNILVPEDARIFDLNGRAVSGDNLARGIYLVTKPGFKKAVKVMIR